jgi:hypothetical protein
MHITAHQGPSSCLVRPHSTRWRCSCAHCVSPHLQEAQRLNVEFSDYAAVLTRNLNACVREPHTFLAVLMVQMDGSARLEFIQVRAVVRQHIAHINAAGVGELLCPSHGSSIC